MIYAREKIIGYDLVLHENFIMNNLSKVAVYSVKQNWQTLSTDFLTIEAFLLW